MSNIERANQLARKANSKLYSKNFWRHFVNKTGVELEDAPGKNYNEKSQNILLGKVPFKDSGHHRQEFLRRRPESGSFSYDPTFKDSGSSTNLPFQESESLSNQLPRRVTSSAVLHGPTINQDSGSLANPYYHAKQGLKNIFQRGGDYLANTRLGEKIGSGNIEKVTNLAKKHGIPLLMEHGLPTLAKATKWIEDKKPVSQLASKGLGWLGNKLFGQRGRQAAEWLTGKIPFEEGGPVPTIPTMNPGLQPPIPNPMPNSPNRPTFGRGRDRLARLARFRDEQLRTTTPEYRAAALQKENERYTQALGRIPDQKELDYMKWYGQGCGFSQMRSRQNMISQGYNPDKVVEMKKKLEDFDKKSRWDRAQAQVRNKLGSSFFQPKPSFSQPTPTLGNRYAEGGHVSKKERSKFEGSAASPKMQHFMNCFK